MTNTVDHEVLLASIRTQQASQPLSILALTEPLHSNSQNTQRDHETTSLNPNGDVHINNNDDTPPTPDPTTLAADLTHYRDLFSKLRFSYLEQVTKEKYLRSIVGDPPVLVGQAENVALEARLVGMKAELKVRKTRNEALVLEMEALARSLAGRCEVVREGVQVLETLPGEIEGLEGRVEGLRAEVRVKEREMEVDNDGDDAGDGERMNMGLAETEGAVDEQRRRISELDDKIAALQRELPGKMRECERVERELVEVEGKRNEVTRLAREVRRIKEEGGRDVLEEKGRWYRAEDQLLRALLGVET